MKDNHQAMIMAGFAGDALSLGVHWIYDPATLKQDYGRIDAFVEPGIGSYHAGKPRGGFTHYGDQAMVLLESLAANQGRFDLEDFFDRWKRFFSDYSGYFDRATKTTLKNIDQGRGAGESGSASNDLAGAARLFPLAFCIRDDEDALAAAAEAQTRMTHADEATLEVSAFFARLLFQVLGGKKPGQSAADLAETHFSDSPVAMWVDAGLGSTDRDSVEVLQRFGLSCHTPEAFPGVIHLIEKYGDNLEEALVQSVMAGGDNAARSLVVGAVLGARTGHLPEAWMDGLVERDRIVGCLERIQAAAG